MMSYCSRQGSSEVQVPTLSFVLHILVHTDYIAQYINTATINHDPAFPESNLMVCTGHNMKAKGA